MARAVRDKPSKNLKKKPAAPVFFGRKRVISAPGEVSKTKSTAEKAAFLRRYLDLPFKNSKNFDQAKTDYINRLYDGDASGALAYRRLAGVRKVKIDPRHAEKYESAGHIVTRRSYKYRGKRRKGTYVLIRPVAQGSTIEARDYGTVEKIGSRIEYKFLLNTFTLPLFLDRPEWYIEEEILRRHKKLFKNHYGTPTFKILFSHGSGGAIEYEDIEQLANYLDKFSEENKGKITGVAVVFHVRKRRKKILPSTAKRKNHGKKKRRT